MRGARAKAQPPLPRAQHCAGQDRGACTALDVSGDPVTREAGSLACRASPDLIGIEADEKQVGLGEIVS